MRREIGAALVSVGLLMVLTSLIQGAASGGYGGVVLIGPIPIVFGSSPGMALISMLMAVLLMIIASLLFRRA